MKELFKILSFAVVCIGFVCACQPEQTPVSDPVAPVVTYAIEEDAVGVQVDSVVLFEAAIQTPGPVECVWYVDGERYAETLSFCWPFRTIGTYQVRFEAFNEAGTAAKEYTVTVSGIPLEVEFSVAEDEIVRRCVKPWISAWMFSRATVTWSMSGNWTGMWFRLQLSSARRSLKPGPIVLYGQESTVKACRPQRPGLSQ